MNQNKQILQFLQQGNSITPLEALGMFNCFRLSARIKNLRDEGHTIKTERVTKNNKTFAKYSLNGK